MAICAGIIHVLRRPMRPTKTESTRGAQSSLSENGHDTTENLAARSSRCPWPASGRAPSHSGPSGYLAACRGASAGQWRPSRRAGLARRPCRACLPRHLPTSRLPPQAQHWANTWRRLGSHSGNRAFLVRATRWPFSPETCSTPWALATRRARATWQFACGQEASTAARRRPQWWAWPREVSLHHHDGMIVWPS